jgi:acyl-CoA synthetase (AMP-forming)/AMP-acid ligase II
MLRAYNTPEWMLSLLAIWGCGAVPVLANRWWSAEEVRHSLAAAAPTLLISDLTAPGPIASIPHLEVSTLRFAFDAAQASPVITPEDPEFPLDGEDEPAVIVFTSGSSGTPKGVVLSSRSVIANQHNLLARSRRLPDTLTAENTQSSTLLCTPLFHVGGITALLMNLLTGSKIIMTVGRFDPGRVLRLLAGERVRTFGGVPTMAVRVLEHPDFETFDLSALQSWPLGGAPVPPGLLDRMRRMLPQLERRGLGNTWGMTESGGHLTGAGAKELAGRPGTVGRPYPAVELRIADPDESGNGEILARSPTVMLGYLGGATDSSDMGVDDQGWLRTGDIGHLDSDGYLYLESRSKDVVIRGGENIACSHVEFAITEHPGVIEAAVVGVPHEELGEELAAVVVTRVGDDLDEDDLRRFVADRLAYFEVPTVWQIQHEPLPTLAGEKIDKRSVRAGLAGRLSAAQKEAR